MNILSYTGIGTNLHLAGTLKESSSSFGKYETMEIKKKEGMTQSGRAFHIYFIALCISLISGVFNSVDGQSSQGLNYKEYIYKNIPEIKEINTFINGPSWAKFDSELGYVLGNYIPHDGLNGSSTISTTQANGARKSFLYNSKSPRINAYGDSFTQCHQVSDGETWEEYLAAHIGESIGNFGMGGYGVYQSYCRMLLNEETAYSADYVIFYIWGDDHIRSLLRCRYMLIKNWMDRQNKIEGFGRMFHGNFWPNVEFDFLSESLIENPNRISDKNDLLKMTDPQWMYENLKEDFALEMALYKSGKIVTIDQKKMSILANFLNFPLRANNVKELRNEVAELLDRYSFYATELILRKAKEFAHEKNKKLLVVLFDPGVTVSLIKQGTRYDQQIVDFLKKNDFFYFDMNLIHVEDFKKYNLNLNEYMDQYLIGHYNPKGNHFFAFSILPTIISWLDPKPITYQKLNQQAINFEGYLEKY